MDFIAGYIAAGLIGIALGLVGGGGSILTVPVLVYCFHIDPTLATAYSLFIVGSTSLVGAMRCAMHDLIDFKAALLFSIPAFIAVYLVRRYFLPFIPDEIFRWDHFIFTRNIALMIFFALLMSFAGISMIVSKQTESDGEKKYNLLLMITKGFLLGAVTGVVGAGGGFLIIPVLVLMAGVPMKKAVGTSLAVIALKSLIGFVGDLESGQQIDFYFIAIISLIAIAGIFFGSYISTFIEGRKLRSIFGWFVVAMSVVVFFNQVTLLTK